MQATELDNEPEYAAVGMRGGRLAAEPGGYLLVWDAGVLFTTRPRLLFNTPFVYAVAGLSVHESGPMGTLATSWMDCCVWSGLLVIALRAFL